MSKLGRVGSFGDDPNARTIASYEAAAGLYTELWQSESTSAVFAFVDAFAGLVGERAAVLEIGSGTGADADRLERCGVRVHRTDATSGFVTRLRDRAVHAEVLDVLRDDLGGPWHGVYANAVFLHLKRTDLVDVLARIARAVRDGGVLAFTLKEGDGEEWSSARLGVPRYFAYWREPELRAVLSRSGWEIISISHRAGGRDDWLMCMCRRRASAAQTSADTAGANPGP